MRGSTGRLTAVLLLSLVGTAAAPSAILRRPGEIEFTATVHTSAFDGDLMMAGYHAIVSNTGGSAHAALLRSDSTDTEVLQALEAAGGKPGNNLPMAAWTERKDPKNPAPDSVIAGTPVEVFLRLPGHKDLVPLAEVLEDPGGRGLELRLGGNAANIPIFKSGCILCLYSCPGSKVGNARYSVRDYEKGVTRFRTRRGALPPDGTTVGVVLRLIQD